MFAYQVAAYRRSEGIASLITFGAPVDSRATRVFGVVAEDVVTEIAGLLADHVLVHVTAAGLGRPARLPDAGPGEVHPGPDPVPAATARPRGPAAARGPAPVPRQHRLRRLSRAGHRRTGQAVPGPQPDAAGRLRRRRRDVDAGRHHLPGALLRRDAGLDRATAVGPGDRPRRAPRRDLRGRGRHRALRHGRRVRGDPGHLAAGRAPGSTWREDGGASPRRPDGIAVLDVDAEYEPRPSTAPLHAGVDVAGYAVALARSGLGGGRRRVAHPRPRWPARRSRRCPDSPGSSAPAVRRGSRWGRCSTSAPATPPATTSSSSTTAGTPTPTPPSGSTTWCAACSRSACGQGERVGVLMNTRPSALTAITALNRIGAVAVMLRPDGATAREAELGEVRRIIADPEHADGRPRRAPGLGVRARRRRRPRARWARASPTWSGSTPALVQIPDWYVPNPGKASDLAFLLFTGEGQTTRLPPGHQRAVGPLGLRHRHRRPAVGRRHRLQRHAAAPRRRPADQRRRRPGRRLPARADHLLRPGHVLGRGAPLRRHRRLLHLDAARRPDRGRPRRPASGTTRSGSSSGPACRAWLWQRTLDRFPTAAVLEFFVSSSEDVILANISGRKVGAKGRPIPASAEVAVVACDLATGEVRRDYDGLGPRLRHRRGRPADRPHLGLDARARCGASWRPRTPGPPPGTSSAATPTATTGWSAPSPTWCTPPAASSRPPRPRTPSASWTPSRWSLRTASAWTRTVTPSPTPRRSCTPRSSLRPGRTLDAEAVTKALSGLSALQQPAVVRVLPTIPVTTWWRPLRAALRADAGTEALVTWVRAVDGRYAEPGRPRRSAPPRLSPLFRSTR